MTNSIVIVQYVVAQIGLFIITNKMRHVYIHADLHSVNTVVYTATTPAKLKRRLHLRPKPKDNKDYPLILDFSLMLYFTATSGQPFYQKVTVKLNQNNSSNYPGYLLCKDCGKQEIWLIWWRIHCPRKLSSVFHMSTPSLSRTLCWLIFANCKQTRNIWEGGTSTEELPRPDWPVGESMGHFLHC